MITSHEWVGDARYVPIWPSTRRSFMYPILMTAKQSYDHTIPRSNLAHTIYIILFTTKFTHVIQYMVISLSKAYPKNSYVELYSPIVFLSRYQCFFRGYRRRRRNRHDHDSRTYWYNSTTKKRWLYAVISYSITILQSHFFQSCISAN